ncbi:MAG TPA: DNA methyltransferase [Candidatus Paceibacterota bacterium]
MGKYQLKTSAIYCGDNLDMLKEVPDESVDLIYIDPPFNSNRSYEIFWGDTQEKRAFEDRFGDAEAYIAYMRPRVVEMYRVLKKTGSFYYHCDWHASHYVKIMLDQIFNFNNFVNEIIWNYEGTQSPSPVKLASKHQIIFRYAKNIKLLKPNKLWYEHEIGYDYSTLKKDEKGYFRIQGLGDYSQESIKRLEAEGRIYHTSKGTQYLKYYIEERNGKLFKKKKLSDVWADITQLGTAIQKEKRGYPTQKPLKLLERILDIDSKKGDVVLDAFCGCGTALVAAQKHGRKWIGIDISPTACRVMTQRLWDEFRLTEGKDFELINMLRNEAQLREIPPFEFENWAVIALGGIPNRAKVGDYGIDGKLYPIEREKVKTDDKGLFGDVDTYYPIQVKQKDKAGRPDIDAFETAMQRDKRRKGYFISFDFTEDAMKEIKRLDKEGELEIIPITVKGLLDKSGFEKIQSQGFK